MKFVDFMSGMPGRAIRMILGLVIILMGGFFATNDTVMMILCIVGAVLFLAGALHICVANLFVGRKLNELPNRD